MKQKTSKTLYRFAEVLAGIMEVLHWIAAVTMIAFGIVAAVAWEQLERVIAQVENPSLSTYGFEIVAREGSLKPMAIWLFAITAVIILSLMAMVCRNVRLILKLSRDGSPFQRDNVRMLREMGFFFLAIPVISLTMGVLLILLLGDTMEGAFLDPTHFVIGVFLLCLSLVFDRGAALEAETEGLV